MNEVERAKYELPKNKNDIIIHQQRIILTQIIITKNNIIKVHIFLIINKIYKIFYKCFYSTYIHINNNLIIKKIRGLIQ
jgi:hypothetical protein